MRSNVLDFNSRQLRAVLVVAEHRSFIAAAAALKISQPALTRTIKQVEHALNVELFSRTTRQVTITQAGKEFVALAERLLNDLKIGIGSVRKHGEQPRGQIIVSSVLPLADAAFCRVVAEFVNKNPGIELQLREGMHSNVLDDVRGGIADFGIAYVNALPKTFAAESVGVEALHVVMPMRHPLTRRRKVAAEDLRESMFVSYPIDANTRRLVDAVAATAKFAPHHAVTVNRAATLMAMVRGGAGIAVVPSSERPSASDREITSRPLERSPISRLGLFRLRERELNGPASEFYAQLKAWIKSIAPHKLRRARKSNG